jgi:metal-responsive CopG/Arc/MetJ family transcriptional regulator
MDKSTVVVVRLPKAMLASIDALARAQFLTRSEALRALLRQRIVHDHENTSSWPPHGPPVASAVARIRRPPHER